MKVAHIPYESRPLRMILAVLAVLFVFCTGPAIAAPEPGSVTIVCGAETAVLDPQDTVRGTVSKILTKNVVESLVDRSVVDGKMTPTLALSWKQIDPLTWQFSLRKGVKFHDGADFNADAVVFNLKRLYNKSVPTQTKDKFFSAVTLQARAVDNYTVEIKANKPEPLMMTLISVLSICSPNTPFDKLTREPIGTGPYKFVKWDSGVQIILERFDGYWGKQPQVKKATYVWRSESAVQAAMVAIGEADLAMLIAPQDANRPDMDYSYFNAETTVFRIGGQWDPPLNDKRVRLALNYALDRKSFVGSILSKDVMPATQVVPPGTVGYNPDLKVYPFDPQKAKQLLAEAKKDGVPVDKEITLVGRAGMFPNNIELCEAAMNMWKDVGLNVKLRVLEHAVFNRYREKPFPTGPYVLLNMHDNTKGDAAFSVFFFYHCKGNASNTCDKTEDDLIERAQAATGDERQKLFQASFKRVYEDLVSDAMLFHLVGYTRVGKRINFKPSMASTLEFPLSEITFK